MTDTMDRIKELAQERLNELEAEMGPLRALLERGPRPGRPPGKPGRRRLSRKARKALSTRMKAYWAARRAGKK